MTTKIGDIFSATISTTSKKYLQYIISDITQLNSDVIRVFKKEYKMDETPSLDQIINNEVDFLRSLCYQMGSEIGVLEEGREQPCCW